MLGISAHNNGSNSFKVLIMLRRAVLLSTLLLPFSSIAVSQEQQPASGQKSTPPNVLVLKQEPPPATQPQFKPQLRAVDIESRPKLSNTTRMQLIGLMDAEFVHVRKYIPLGAKDLVVTPEGVVKPTDAQLFQAMQASGAAAKLGDKVQITNVLFHEKSIVFEINGGAKKKTKWYQHVQIMGAGGATPTGDTSQSQPTGATMTLQFNKHVPEMNADELKKLISPVLDFSVKTAAEVYVETLPPKLRDAIKKHEVLVGMNKDMVVAAKDRPRQKIREKDEQGKEYEEWLYGTAPQDVTFVRFHGDEVTQVKIAKISGQVITKTEKEVDVKDGVVSLASLKASDSPQDVQREAGDQSKQQPAKRPTLKRPGEADETTPAPEKTPDNPPRDNEPQWGEKKPADDTPSQPPQKPPL
jgi:hypothetical protein